MKERFDALAKTKFIRLPGMRATHVGRKAQIEAIEEAIAGDKPAVVLHGPSGHGKSCTAAYAASVVLDARFELAYSFDCRGGLSGEEFLIRICQFLEHNSIGSFQNIALSPIPYKMKLDFIGKILDKTSLLIILDGYEPGVGLGAANMMAAIDRLTTTQNEGARLIITTASKLDIDATHIEFGPMNEVEAAELLETYGASKPYATLVRSVHKASGGNPYLMSLIAWAADPAGLASNANGANDIIAAVVMGLESEGAESIIAQASAYDKAVAKDGIVVSDTTEADIESLTSSGLLDETASGFYQVPNLVREYYKNTMDDAVWNERLIGCAAFHEAYSRKEGVIWHALYAYSLYEQAAQHTRASSLALFLFETLIGWGQTDLMEELCNTSLKTATGELRGAILNFYALLKQSQRKPAEAAEMYNEALELYESVDNKPAIAGTLDHLGRAYHDSNDFDGALDALKRASVLYDSLGNMKALALANLQMGKIYHERRDIRTAAAHYDKCMSLLDELQDKAVSASALYQIGLAFLSHKDYKNALKNLIISLAIYSQIKSPLKTNVTAAIKQIEEAIGAENIKKLNDEVLTEIKSKGIEGTA